MFENNMAVSMNIFRELRLSNSSCRMSKSSRYENDEDKENACRPANGIMSFTSTPVCPSVRRTSSLLKSGPRMLFSPVVQSEHSARKGQHSTSSDRQTSWHTNSRRMKTSEDFSQSSHSCNTTNSRRRLRYTYDSPSRTRHRRSAIASSDRDHSPSCQSDGVSGDSDVLLTDVSRIGEMSDFEVYDQASSDGLHENFHSTFSYPLHSTACSGGSDDDGLDISNDLMPAFVKRFVLKTPSDGTDAAVKASTSLFGETRSLDEESRGKTATEAFVDHDNTEAFVDNTDGSDPFCDSSYLTDDEVSIDVDEYAAEYDSLRKHPERHPDENDSSEPLSHPGNSIDSLTYPESDVSRDRSTSGLSDVWYSPNNTLDSHPQLSTPYSHQTHKIAKITSTEEDTHILPVPSQTAQTQLSDDTDSGCSSCDIQSQTKPTIICDNTGKYRRVTLQECSACFSASTDSDRASSVL